MSPAALCVQARIQGRRFKPLLPPGRELPTPQVLFTVVSRTEKYSAKLVIDMVVQRLGDSIAAAAFQLLDVQLHLGVGGVAAAGCAACVAWLLASLRLGREHARLAAARQRGEGQRRRDKHVV